MEQIDNNQLSGYYKEDLPGDSLLYIADELSAFLENNLSSHTQLSAKFEQINDQINSLPLPTNAPSGNTFIYSPTNEVSDIIWKEYIPEPSAALSSYYLQITDASGTLAWTKVKALPDESAATSGLVLTSYGAEDSARWEAYSAISRSVGDIFYTTRLDVLDDNGKMLNGAVPCNGKDWTNLPQTRGGIIDLLSSGILPYVSTTEYDTILATQNGVCQAFGWDGEDDVRVPMLNDVFIESSISTDNISGFTVSSDTEGNMISSFNGYLEAGIPNITGKIERVSDDAPAQLFGEPVSAYGAFSIELRDNLYQALDYEQFATLAHSFSIDASRCSTVYGKSDTVQPRAVRYIPMIQLYNSVNDAAVVKYDDIMNSIQAGHMLGEVFYTTRLDTVDSDTSAYMINGAVACNGQTRYCSVNISAETETEGDSTDYNKYLSNTIPGLLKLGKLPYVSMNVYNTILTEHGVCRCFGWDGNKDTKPNSDVFRKYRVPKLDKVFIEAGLNASDVSGGQYIEAGLPNITGVFSGVGQTYGTDGDKDAIPTVSGAVYIYNTVDDPTAGVTISNTGVKDDVFGFSALSGETNVNGEVKSEDEYHVYGKSNTVQPPAVCYVPMVQIVNKVEASMIDEYSDLQNQIEDIKNYKIYKHEPVQVLFLTGLNQKTQTGVVYTTISEEKTIDGPCYLTGYVNADGAIENTGVARLKLIYVNTSTGAETILQHICAANNAGNEVTFIESASSISFFVPSGMQVRLEATIKFTTTNVKINDTDFCCVVYKM